MARILGSYDQRWWYWYNNDPARYQAESGDGGLGTKGNSLAGNLERVVAGLLVAQQRIIVAMAEVHGQQSAAATV